MSGPSVDDLPAPPRPDDAERRREQRAWYWYDWANSAYVTTVATVLFAPYVTALAKEAAVDDRVTLVGLSVAPGALAPFLAAGSTILSAVALPLLGAYADRTPYKRKLLGAFAWLGSAFAALIFFATGSDWQLAAVGLVGANLCLGASLVFNDAILCLIATEEERDRVSSRGWAWGYLGGGLLLVVNLAMVQGHDAFGMDKGLAARVSMLSAAVWWAAFTFIPYLRLRDHPPTHVEPESGNVVAQTFGQLWTTLRELRTYPVAFTFLLAFLFFNDGIQTVILQASLYGTEELGFEQGTLIATILMVQFVGMAGALLFGRLAARFGTKHVILAGLVLWMVIVTVAMVIPDGALVPFLALGFGIGLVLGGTQALSRSYFSLLIPRGREAEYFSLYHAMDRGTSWFGSLVFGLVYQLTGSYRPAIFALIVFFVVGGLLLSRVDTERGIAQAAAA